MRFERLVIEAEDNTFSLDFHPRLTVIGGVGQMEREGLISELVGSLSSSREGVHAEIVADNGNRFALFRPYGARARVIDVEAAQDVSDRFEDAAGEIDLLSVADLDTRTAKRMVRLTATDLKTTTHHDQIVRRLAAADPTELWSLATRVEVAQAALDNEAELSGSDAEDAAVVARIEERHREFESAQVSAERARRISFAVAVVSALAAVPAAIMVGRPAAMVLVIGAAVVTALSFAKHKQMEAARAAEEEALAEAGANSYLGFHLQRVNGMLATEQARKRLMDVAKEHEAAMAEWFAMAGDIMVDWARTHRGEIEECARLQGDVRQAVPTAGDDEVAALAHALLGRLEEVRTAGPGGESLPLVLDDALTGLDPAVKASLLEMLTRSSFDQQIVFLTEDADVRDWARVEAMTGDVSILEPSGADAAAPATAPAAVA